VLKKVSSEILIDELFVEIDRWLADGMKRPTRLKMAKPLRWRWRKPLSSRSATTSRSLRKTGVR
jgi:hypothetical protein